MVRRSSAIHRLPSFCAAVALLCTPLLTACAQVEEAQEPSIDVLGLRTWTRPMLEDSLRKFQPDVQLGDAACGVLLRDSLGFPDASVLRFRDGRVVLAVIEPQDSARVVLRQAPTHASGFDGPWNRLTELRTAELSPVDYAAATFLAHSVGEDVPVDAADSALVHEVWSLLEAPIREVNVDATLQALSSSPDPEERRAAALYMIRHVDVDRAWYGLVGALRDSDGTVRSTAQTTLRAFRTSAAHPIDWTPALADLRHLLDGTTLVFHTEVVKLLLETGIEPAVAQGALSAFGAGLLLDELGASHEYVREPAHAFLTLAAGEDHGADPADWRAWTGTLRSD